MTRTWRVVWYLPQGRLFGRRMCTITARPPSRFRLMWENARGYLLPSKSPHAALEFKVLKHHTGHKATLGTIVAINVFVFLGWQIPNLRDTWSRLFLWSTDSWQSKQFHLLLTSSFSHYDLHHLIANMTFLLYLGKRLHQFMGRKYFLALYFSGAIAGKIAWDHAPQSRVESVASSPARYRNILTNDELHTSRGLGASDSVFALIAVWYLVFPRTPFHLFRKMHLFTEFLKSRSVFPNLTKYLTMANLSTSSLWFMPVLCFQDYYGLFSREHQPSQFGFGGGAAAWAHMGGAVSGVLFHVAVASRLKSQFFPFSWGEMLSRMAHLGASLAFFSWAAPFWLAQKEVSVRIPLGTWNNNKYEWVAKFTNPAWDGEPGMLKVPFYSFKEVTNLKDERRANYLEVESELLLAMEDANECCQREADDLATRLDQLLAPDASVIKAKQSVFHKRTETGALVRLHPERSPSDLRYGACDNHFYKIRAMMAERGVHFDAIEPHLRRFHFSIPDPTKQQQKLTVSSPETRNTVI